MGYYINFYGLAPETRKPGRYPDHRFDEFLGRIYRKPEGQCRNDGYVKCFRDKKRRICHRLTPSQMKEFNNKAEPDHVPNVDTSGFHFDASKHSSESLTTHIWERGFPFDPVSKVRKPNIGLTIDAVSIGTKKNKGQLEGQVKSWGSHPSIRYLFASTENDDHDPYCHLNLTHADMDSVSRRCTKELYGGSRQNPSRLTSIRNQYPKVREKRIKSKKQL